MLNDVVVQRYMMDEKVTSFHITCFRAEPRSALIWSD